MLRKLRIKIITFLAGTEPILLNWNINGALVKDDKPAVFIPGEKHRYSAKELSEEAVLTPVKNVIC